MVRSPYLRRLIAKKRNEKEKLIREAGAKLADINEMQNELAKLYFGLGYMNAEIKNLEKMDIESVRNVITL